MFRRRKPRTLFAFNAVIAVCLDHVRLSVIETPRYLLVSDVSSILLRIAYDVLRASLVFFGITLLFIDTFHIYLLLLLSCLWLHCLCTCVCKSMFGDYCPLKITMCHVTWTRHHEINLLILLLLKLLMYHSSCLITTFYVAIDNDLYFYVTDILIFIV